MIFSAFLRILGELKVAAADLLKVEEMLEMVDRVFNEVNLMFNSFACVMVILSLIQPEKKFVETL